MSTTRLSSFDSTVQEGNLWLKSVTSRLDGVNRHKAYIVLKSVLHALRDRIGPENAVHLGAQLPMIIRGMYYEGWRLAASSTKERHKADFLEHVARDFSKGMKLDPERATRAVLEVMRERIDPGEIAKLQRVLPEELRELWRHVPQQAYRTANVVRLRTGGARRPLSRHAGRPSRHP